jgi:hypothetical protein
MGVGIEVGILADFRESGDDEGFNYYFNQFDVLNRCLQSAGLPTHNEPEDCEIWTCDLFSFSGLHCCLRRLAAHLDQSGKIPPPADRRNIAEDPVLLQYYESNFVGGFDHLICHSDYNGLYLPIDFPDVLFPNPELGLGGLGSTIQLLRECEQLAQILKIPKHLDENSKELDKVSYESQGEGSCLWEKYGIESCVCVRLIRGCQHSIRAGAAIVFV